MVSTSKPDTQPDQAGVTRRSVAKTAAHAAWAVPAIQIATSVPAFASHSGGHLSLVPGASQYSSTAKSGTARIGVKNEYTAPASGVTVQVEFPNPYVRQAPDNANANGADKAVAVTMPTGSPWSPGAVVYSGTASQRVGRLTFTLGGTSPSIGAGSTTTLEFNFTTESKTATGQSLSVIAKATGFADGVGAIAFA